MRKEDLEEDVKRAMKGDIGSFRRIYERFYRKIFAFTYHLLNSYEAAEEVTQDTFLSIYRNIGSLKDVEKFESWMFTIARNYAKQYKKKDINKNNVLKEEDKKEGEVYLDDNPEENLMKSELDREIKRAINSLDLKYREVFILANIEGYSYKEIARMVGRSVQSVKTDIHRARLKLRKYLEKFLKREDENEM